ncbi:ABC transporter substrate-binding protein [Fluviispira multicolorata]|uniref:ABC transporter substrate-binding protein n=1 Tax=Fluviispira multicolorata TaxID=2654512 RepID=A0A833JDF0_9BACT|nr:ABC transporter substrate-binding protein [Fluviispira multicolorata]KAB8031843.1 ABC transporter substrate-binding protein [Fluviispira multicolorata]
MKSATDKKIKFLLISIVFLNLTFFPLLNALEVKIGALLSLTNSLASYGQDAKNGIELALDQLKKSDIKLTVVYEDTQSTPSESAKAINKLIVSDKVEVVIGDMTSSNTIAAASIAEKAKIPILTPSSTNDTITMGKEYIFRACFIDSFQGYVMSKFSLNNLNAKTAIVLEDSDSDYSKGLSKSFVYDFEKNHGKVLKILKYSQKDTSYTSQLADVRRIKPDVLFIPGFHQQVGVILREAKDLQIRAKILGGDGWDTPELRNIAKGAEVGAYISNHYSSSGENLSLKNFVKAYKEKYHVDPSSFAALAYDSVNMVYIAVINAKSNNPEKIKNSLSKIKDFKGVTGTISIDQNHNATKPAVILEYIPNGYKYVTSVKPLSF